MDNRNEGVFKRPEDVAAKNPYPTIGGQEIEAPVRCSMALHGDKPLKFEEGKADLSLVPPMWGRVLARVFEYGLQKYYKNSWKQFTLDKAIGDLIPAAMRHIDEYREGGYIDKESKLPHLACAAWNLLVVLWHSESNKGNYK